MSKIRNLLAAAAAIALIAVAAPAVAAPAAGAVKNVVLVHGAFADGSGWAPVYKILTDHGYTVTIVQNPTTSLADDVSYTRRALAAQDGPAVLVGHSYGGMVITEAGTDPKVAALVYIAAFAPDKGESVESLNATPVPGAVPPPILPPQDGFLLLDRTKFPQAFAADVDPATTAFMAASQVPWNVKALGGVITAPAWKAKPSWFLLPTEDRMIPPQAQRAMAGRAGARVTEVQGSHAIFLSHPDVVARLIEEAARAASETPKAK